VNTILILEDEPCVMGVLRLTLSDYTLIEATNAHEAFQQFVDHGRKVDLLLADVTLPTSSGVHVARLLRAANPKLAVILMSGRPPGMWNDEAADELRRLGAHSVTLLEKPFSPDRLQSTVQGLLGQRPLPRMVRSSRAIGL
jgi:DNA-binding response OmpR family regulator